MHEHNAPTPTPKLTGLKSLESAKRKIASDYEGDCGRMKDLVRFTASFAGCARMSAFVDMLRSSSRRGDGLEVLSLKNKYSSPTPLGYRDLNVTLRVQLGDGEGDHGRMGDRRGGGGRFHVCELQVNLDDMLVAKELAHAFYEEVLFFVFVFLALFFLFLFILGNTPLEPEC